LMNWLKKQMPSWLIKIITALIANWGGKLLSFIVDLIKRYAEYKKIGDENNMQADKVKAISEEIKKLISEGKEVPEELKQRLRDESRRLISGSNTDNGN
jgi:hypothetical protein